MNKKIANLSVYMIGVGGFGMATLCAFLLDKGFTVSGSDKVKGSTVCKLIEKGLIFYKGHEGDYLKDADIVIYSSAISDENSELKLARTLNKAIYKRSELLNLVLSSHSRSIGISGSHGKTTSTAMLYEILSVNNPFVSCFLGGEYKGIRTPLKNKVAIAEICEYAKNINDINCDYSVCLNIDNDHLDSYGNIENLRSVFCSFLSRSKIKFINADDCRLSLYRAKKTVTFGILNDCDYKAENILFSSGNYTFDLIEKGEYKCKITLSVVGKHNVYNALSAIAVSRVVFKCNYEQIIQALKNFKGVERRFEFMGELYGKQIICDYAHHPTEIESVLKTVKEIYKKDYLVVFQPHTYSRTKLLFKDFFRVLKGENAIIYKEYPSREEYDFEGSSERLAKELELCYYDNFFELLSKVKRSRKKVVIVLGAGNLYNDIVNEVKSK
ncbi:MAG: hypothetical protein IJA97_06110 [Clostridia bacterium]|nr:hypothetical protein [Clostridia bacterium]